MELSKAAFTPRKVSTPQQWEVLNDDGDVLYRASSKYDAKQFVNRQTKHEELRVRRTK